MDYWDKKLIREQWDFKLEMLKNLYNGILPTTGWIKSIREALGMTTADLAKRVNLDQSRITRLENSEIEGDLKISSMKKIAAGLNMKFVYGFVPSESLEKIVQDQARKIAMKRLEKLDHTMRLEGQELSQAAKNKDLEDLIQKILHNESKGFWKE